MNIVLADCFHDSDKGGGGLIGGALRIISEVCSKRNCIPQISLVYRFSEDDPRYKDAARLTSQEFPNVKILPAPISSRRGSGIHWISWLFRAYIQTFLRLLFPSLSKHPSIRAFQNADLIIFKGGHFYRSYSKNRFGDALILYRSFFSIIMAIRLKKKCFLLSHSFGPFHSTSSKKIVTAILMRTSKVYCRESISRDILIECGIAPEHVSVSPDLGFATYGTTPNRITAILEQYGLKLYKYVAVTARPWFYLERKQGREEKYRSYIKNLSKLCDYIAENIAEKVALVVQNDGAHNVTEPDIEPLQDIFKSMANRDTAIIMDEDFSFRELTSIYGNALLTLGTRLHSCIFSLSAGTPAIAIAYSHKANGIMDMAGAEKYILDINNLSFDEGKKMIEDILSMREVQSKVYTTRVNELRKELYMLFEKILYNDNTEE